MSNEQIIKCVFCQGTGNNPHFRGTCPVCKGRGKNEVVGKYMTCSSCRGLGQKGGTTLSCYDCGGLGVVPDTRETFRKAREEIGEARKDLARERPARRPVPRSPKGEVGSLDEGGAELTEKPKKQKHKLLNVLLKSKDEENEPEEKTHFCQCCGDEVSGSITIKICSDCFDKVKELRAYT